MPLNPMVIPSLVTGAGALLGATAGKNKQRTIDPYANLRGQYNEYLQGKLGTSTPYQYNPSFEIPQPAIESQTEQTISGGLGNLPQKRTDIQDIGNKYYEAQKSQMAERHAEEQQQAKNMYNRLGLMSSTPGLRAQTDLGRKQQQEYNVLSADVARQGIDQEMKATALAEDIANMYMTQGQQLGQLQRGYSQYPINMSQADIERRTQEELANAELVGSLISNNPPNYYYEPNIASQLGGAAQDVGTQMMMYELLKKQGQNLGQTV